MHGSECSGWSENSFQISPGRVNERRNVSFCANLREKKGGMSCSLLYIFFSAVAVLTFVDLIKSSPETLF